MCNKKEMGIFLHMSRYQILYYIHTCYRLFLYRYEVAAVCKALECLRNKPHKNMLALTVTNFEIDS